MIDHLALSFIAQYRVCQLPKRDPTRTSWLAVMTGGLPAAQCNPACLQGDTTRTSWPAGIIRSLHADSDEAYARAGVTCSHGSFSSTSRVCRRKEIPERLCMYTSNDSSVFSMAPFKAH